MKINKYSIKSKNEDNYISRNFEEYEDDKETSSDTNNLTSNFGKEKTSEIKLEEIDVELESSLLPEEKENKEKEETNSKYNYGYTTKFSTLRIGELSEKRSLAQEFESYRKYGFGENVISDEEFSFRKKTDEEKKTKKEFKTFLERTIEDRKTLTGNLEEKSSINLSKVDEVFGNFSNFSNESFTEEKKKKKSKFTIFFIVSCITIIILTIIYMYLLLQNPELSKEIKNYLFSLNFQKIKDIIKMII